MCLDRGLKAELKLTEQAERFPPRNAYLHKVTMEKSS